LDHYGFRPHLCRPAANADVPAHDGAAAFHGKRRHAAECDNERAIEFDAERQRAGASADTSHAAPSSAIHISQRGAECRATNRRSHDGTGSREPTGHSSDNGAAVPNASTSAAYGNAGSLTRCARCRDGVGIFALAEQPAEPVWQRFPAGAERVAVPQSADGCGAERNRRQRGCGSGAILGID
jgi:hypothetical protein